MENNEQNSSKGNLPTGLVLALKIIGYILLIAVIVVLFLWGLAAFPTVATWFYALAIILCLPIKPFRKLFKKIPFGIVLRVILVVLLVYLAFVFSPEVDYDDIYYNDDAYTTETQE